MGLKYGRDCRSKSLLGRMESTMGGVISSLGIVWTNVVIILNLPSRDALRLISFCHPDRQPAGAYGGKAGYADARRMGETASVKMGRSA